jgi:hypothetical protein
MGFQQRASVNRASYLISRRFRSFAEDDVRAGVNWRVRPELRYNDSGERLGNYLGVFRESRRRSGAVLNTSLEVTGAGVDDLISRGNGDVQMDARLVALTQNYQSARIGNWRCSLRARCCRKAMTISHSRPTPSSSTSRATT